MTDGGAGVAEPIPPTASPETTPAAWRRTGWKDPDERHERTIAIVVAIVLGLAIAVATFGARPAGRPNRTLPAAAYPHVLIVPIGDIPVGQLSGLPADYRAEYGLDVTIAPSIPGVPYGYDLIRRQYAAQDLIDAMAAAHPEETGGTRILVAITTEDMYIRDVDWDWAFALREADRLAVISTRHMTGVGLADPWQLMRKMLTRELGFLCFKLSPTADPGDLMYKDVLSVDDLIRMDDHL
jgi:hypothetical protein